jgi:hypothetical protein
MQKTVIEDKKKEVPVQLFFLKNDENQNVEVTELEEINFEELKSRLEKGESIFIARKQKHKSDLTLIGYDIGKEPWYFVRS